MFDSESGHTSDFKIGTHSSFLPAAQHYRDRVQKRRGSLLVVPLEKALSGFSPF